jgi:ATP-dependent Clp protease ATP-binding subunit ClpC
VVTPEDVTVTISQWAGIPVSELTVEEEKVLKHLESLLSQRVIGQEKAIKAVAQAIRRNRAGLQDPKRPIGSFIFLGPSGVGKTELCKAVATIVFGSEENLIRLDMSEYMEKHAVSRIIGSPPGYVGYDDGGQLTEKVRRRPYSVILFDEVEKAHSDIYNLLLQVLEDGILTDSQGRQISFRNTILIMTSNLGARRLTESRTLGFSEADEQQAKRDMEKEVLGELKKYFRPEFLNRVDACIVFDMLNHTTIRKIAQKMLRELQERLDKIRIKTVFSEEVTELLIHQCKDKKCGVRPLRRAIRTMIENPLADIVIEQRAQQPMKVTITVQNGKPVFSTEKEQA